MRIHKSESPRVNNAAPEAPTNPKPFKPAAQQCNQAGADPTPTKNVNRRKRHRRTSSISESSLLAHHRLQLIPVHAGLGLGRNFSPLRRI